MPSIGLQTGVLGHRIEGNMVRVFGHFLPVPPLLLELVEGAILSIALCVVVGRGDYLPVGFEIQRLNFSILLSLSAIAAMLAVGLYSDDAFLHRRIILIRILIALILAAPIAFMINFLFTAVSRTPNDLGSYWFVKAAVAWLICISITRIMFARFSDLEIFKRRILVVGSGARALEIEKLSKRKAHMRGSFHSHSSVPVAIHVSCDPWIAISSPVANPWIRGLKNSARRRS